MEMNPQDELKAHLMATSDEFRELAGQHTQLHKRVEELEAKHLLTAVIMTAPGTIMMAKMFVPETEVPKTMGSVRLEVERTDVNVIDAGETHIGQVTPAMGVISVTPTITAGAYVTGNAVGGKQSLTSAARVSGACFAMGEAVGAAADLALSGNTIPRDIAVEKLQQALQQQGAFIGRDQAVPTGL